MASPAAVSYLKRHQEPDLQFHEYEHAVRGVRVPVLNTAVIAAPTSTLLKDIRAGRFNLDPSDTPVIVLPPELAINGKIFGSLEFLIYYSAYIQGNIAKDQPLQVVCTEKQKLFMSQHLSRTIDGPDWNNPATYPFVGKEERTMLNNLKEFYAPKNKDGNPLSLEAYVKFITFDSDKDNAATIPYGDKGSLLIRQVHSGAHVVGYDVIHARPDFKKEHHGSLIVNYNVPEPHLKEIPESAKEDIQNYRHGFAVTCLGNSNGFDPDGYNTSFVVWMGGTGILVDPSEEALTALHEMGITDSDVPYIWVSHCHEDHDSGALHRIMQGKRMNLLASRVVYEEFMIKLESLLKCQGSHIDIDPRKLINWIELEVNKETEIPLSNGKTGSIKTYWNCHTIPTNGAAFSYQGKTYGHSGDTEYGEAHFEEMLSKSVLTKKQSEEMRYRFFDKSGIPTHDLTHFEAGGAPIHTMVLDLINDIHPDFYESVQLYHLSDPALASVGNNPLKKVGLFETTPIIEPTKADRDAYFRDIVENHPYFSKLSIKDAVWEKGIVRTFKANECLVSPNNGKQKSMFIVLSGAASVYDGEKYVARRGAGSAIGDWSHINENTPSAGVIAATDMICLEVNINEIASLDEIRDMREMTRDLRKYTEVFGEALQQLGISADDIPRFILEMREDMKLINCDSGAVLMKEGETAQSVYFVAEGSLYVYDNMTYGDFGLEDEEIIGTVKKGGIVGESAMYDSAVRQASVRAGDHEGGTLLLEVKGSRFRELLTRYPGAMNAFTISTENRRRVYRPAEI